MSLIDQIPGLKDAIDAERHIRDTSFLDMPEVVSGFELKPLTLRHVLTLGAVGNVFVMGGVPTPSEAGAFFIIVGEWRGWKRFFGLKMLGRKPYAETLAAIDEYMKEAFQDAPPCGESGGVSYYSFAASDVDIFAREYGWSEQEILNVPMKRLFQYMKAIAARNGEKVFFNPSDKVRGDWLRAQNELVSKN